MSNKGFSNILIILVVAVLLGAFALYIYNSVNKTRLPDLSVKETVYEALQKNDPAEEFETLEEDESTPEEINNESLEELDTMILELDNDTTLDASLDDLN